MPMEILEQTNVEEGGRKHLRLEIYDSPEAKRKRSKESKWIKKDTDRIRKDLRNVLFSSIAPKPRYLVITRENGNFQKFSPFLIAREITNCAGGPVKEIHKTFNGLYVETVNDSQSLKVQAIKKIGGFPVSVQPHSSLNSSKGVVVCRGLLNCMEEKIVEEMLSQEVTHCRRLTMRRNSEVLASASHVLTFNRPNLPESVRAGIHHLDMRAFTPQTMRCFKCQHFRHTAVRCVR
ncbi:uncharacterized protein LOC142317710 [Lycorma delicatula]|uniref:uncharacterized protein LOC142317710 n=1 Tax=Lycorma delicatula TaxID=130591 RepID=UPI003F515681